MALSLIAAFFLLAAQDQPVATQRDQTAPPSPTAAPAPAQAGATQAQADPADKDYLPAGAPKEDYPFVAWCDGVLAGHMDLAERVKDVLPIDTVQQKVGKAYLRAYVRALDGAPQSKTEEGLKAAEAARQDGWSKWDQARAADHKLGAETYLSYQLPPRCEHAAVRLSHNPDLFRMTAADEATVRHASSSGADAVAADLRPEQRPFGSVPLAPSVAAGGDASQSVAAPAASAEHHSVKRSTAHRTAARRKHRTAALRKPLPPPQ